MKNIILDTSVILKLVLDKDEDDLDKVCIIFDHYLNHKIEIIEPSLYYYEFLNVLNFKLKDKEIIGEASLLIKNLNFKIKNLSSKEELRAIKLCKKYKKISFYNSCFHAIAIENDWIFITSDEKYYKTIKDEWSILLLKDYDEHLECGCD